MSTYEGEHMIFGLVRGGKTCVSILNKNISFFEMENRKLKQVLSGD
jgi:hypothetical protein